MGNLSFPLSFLLPLFEAVTYLPFFPKSRSEYSEGRPGFSAFPHCYQAGVPPSPSPLWLKNCRAYLFHRDGNGKTGSLPFFILIAFKDLPLPRPPPLGPSFSRLFSFLARRVKQSKTRSSRFFFFSDNGMSFPFLLPLSTSCHRAIRLFSLQLGGFPARDIPPLGVWLRLAVASSSYFPPRFFQAAVGRAGGYPVTRKAEFFNASFPSPIGRNPSPPLFSPFFLSAQATTFLLWPSQFCVQGSALYSPLSLGRHVAPSPGPGNPPAFFGRLTVLISDFFP